MTKDLLVGHAQKDVGGTLTDIPINIKPNTLNDHAFITGMTGSGKTGVLFNIITESVANDTPVILFDIKGDLINIANAKLGTRFYGKAAIRCLTPGATYGEPVNLLAGLGDPEDIGASVTSILKLMGLDYDSFRSETHAFLSTIVANRHAKKLPCTIVDLVKAVQTPDFTMLGAMEVDSAFPPKARAQLAGKLNNLMCSPGFAPWRQGVSLDFEELLAKRSDRKVPVIVYTVSHLVDEEERAFALSQGLDALVRYMRAQSGSNNNKLIVAIDEMQGLMPPAPSNPLTKRPILTLLKQARAFGIGMVLATQNPIDIDYKGLSNMGTWLVGKLQTVNDRRRIVDGICSTGLFDSHKLHKVIGGLEKRQFLFATNNKTVRFRTADSQVQLAGPMSVLQVTALYDKKLIEPVDKVAILFAQLREARRLASYEPSNETRVAIIIAQLKKMGVKVPEDTE